MRRDGGVSPAAKSLVSGSGFRVGKHSAAEPPPKVDPIGHKDRKKGLGVGHNHPRAYRRDAGYSIYLGFFVLLVAINSSRPASIFGESYTLILKGAVRLTTIPIASSLYTLPEVRQVREEGIGGGKLLRALGDLGVKAIGFWYHLE
jgi:hypothetical protein